MAAAATAWVWTVRRKLHYTQIFNLMRFSARDVGRRGRDRATGFGVVNIAGALRAPAPRRDHQEPNDDIFEVKAEGLFDRPTRPLTRRGDRRAAQWGLLDRAEDPGDVYRVWIPRGRTLVVRLFPTANVDLDVFRPRARTVFNRRGSIARSARSGDRAEVVRVKSKSSRGHYYYVNAYLPHRGPLDASYRLTLRTRG